MPVNRKSIQLQERHRRNEINLAINTNQPFRSAVINESHLQNNGQELNKRDTRFACQYCHGEWTITTVNNPGWNQIAGGHIKKCKEKYSAALAADRESILQKRKRGTHLETYCDVAAGTRNYDRDYDYGDDFIPNDDNYDCNGSVNSDIRPVGPVLVPDDVERPDMFCHSSETSREILALSDESLSPDAFGQENPSTQYLEWQTRVIHVQNGEAGSPIKLGWVTNNFGERGVGSWHDYVDLSTFVTTAGLSTSVGGQADAMLETFRSILKRHEVHDIFLPSNFKPICEGLKKHIHRQYRFVESTYNLSDVLPKQSIESTGRVPFPDVVIATGICIDAMQTMAEALIINHSSMLLKKPERIVHPVTNAKIYSTFASADVFEKVHACVTRDFGQDAIPFCIGVNIDDTPLDSIGKRTACPVYLIPLNVKDPLFSSMANIYCCGFAPVMTKSDQEILELMKPTIKSITHRRTLLTYLKRQIRMIFLRQLLDPIVTSGINGVLLHVGNDTKPNIDQPKLIVPLIVLFKNDSEAAYKICGLHHHGVRNCRFCIRTQLYSNINEAVDVFGDCGQLRNGFDHELMGKLSEMALFRTMGLIPPSTEAINEGNKRRRLSTEETKIFARAKSFNILPGHNLMHQCIRYVEMNNILTLAQCNPPDTLHTCDKGFVEDIFSKGVSIVALIARILPENYANNLAILDNLVKSFPIRQPVHLFGDKPIRLYKGISYLFKDTQKLKDCAANGRMTNSCIEGTRMVEHLFQFAMSIGVEGRIVPNRIIAYADIPDTHGGGKLKINPTDIVLKAAFSALRLIHLLRSSVFSRDDLKEVRDVTQSVQLHMIRLHTVQQVLLEGIKPVGYIKMHLVTYIPGIFIPAFGCPHIWNTNGTESKHKIDCKRAYGRTSKKERSYMFEMAHVSLIRRGAVLLASASHQIESMNDRTDDSRDYDSCDSEAVSNKEGTFNDHSEEASEGNKIAPTILHSLGYCVLQYDHGTNKFRPVVVQRKRHESGVNVYHSLQCRSMDVMLKHVPLHPLVPLRTVTNLLQDYAPNSLFWKIYREEALYQTPQSNASECRLVDAIRFTPDPSSNVSPFNIYSSSRKEETIHTGVTGTRNRFHRYDFLEIHDAGGVKSTVRVMGILNLPIPEAFEKEILLKVRLQGLTRSERMAGLIDDVQEELNDFEMDSTNDFRKILLLVTRLRDVVKRVRDSIIPYRLMQYDTDARGALRFDLISLDSVYRPCFAMQDPDSYVAFSHEGNLLAAKSMRFWVITHSMLSMGFFDRNADDQAFRNELRNTEFVCDISTVSRRHPRNIDHILSEMPVSVPFVLDSSRANHLLNVMFTVLGDQLTDETGLPRGDADDYDSD